MILNVLGDDMVFSMGASLSGEVVGPEEASASVASVGSLLYVRSVWKRPSFTIPSQLADTPLVS